MFPRIVVSSVLLALVAGIPRVQAEKITLPEGTRIEARVDRELRSDTLVEPDGHVYDIDGVLAPTQEGAAVPIASAKKSAVVLIGNESEEGGKRASTVVGEDGELPRQVADRWSQSGLSPARVVIAQGAEVTIELRQPVAIEETTR
jgi:hypothetical protein